MTPEVSLVVACFAMQRELPRTLRSLSPGYQSNCPASRYEIIVVDNGSSPPPVIEDYAELGATLAIHTSGVSSPSPVHAINLGLSLARAPLIGVWIDGARMASPGLVDACINAAALHPRAIVATFNYHIGPRLQHLSGDTGYDAAIEDGLLRSIDWPTDGYRLFEISTPEKPGGPTAPMLESNAIFLRRELWDELGGYDPRFDEIGGGAVNPDTLIRACELPNTQLVRILGEGTFHQIHGGLTTSSGPRAARLLQHGSRKYLRLRQKPLRAVRTVGWLYDARSGTVTRDAAQPARGGT